MATHSNILAWEIPETEEPVRLQSMGSEKTGHGLATKQQQRNYKHYLRSGKDQKKLYRMYKIFLDINNKKYINLIVKLRKIREKTIDRRGNTNGK